MRSVGHADVEDRPLGELREDGGATEARERFLDARGRLELVTRSVDQDEPPAGAQVALAQDCGLHGERAGQCDDRDAQRVCGGEEIRAPCANPRAIAAASDIAATSAVRRGVVVEPADQRGKNEQRDQPHVLPERDR